jgi:hypothetical protein
MVKEIKLPFEKMYDELVKSNVKLLKFLYDKHIDVLREYEKDILKSKLRVEFA